MFFIVFTHIVSTALSAQFIPLREVADVEKNDQSKIYAKDFEEQTIVTVEENFKDTLKTVHMDRMSSITLWSRGTITYSFKDVPRKIKRCVATLKDAFKVYEKVGLTFTEVDPELTSDYLTIKASDSEASKSEVGRRKNGGIQYMYFNPDHCLNDFVAIHELGHTLGLVHTHQRHDRDLYVKLKKEAMRDNASPTQYEKYENYQELYNPYLCVSELSAAECLEIWNNYPYDYSSVMHYDSFTFSKNLDFPSIVKIKGGIIKGENSQLSLGDKKFLKAIYHLEK